MIISLSLLDSWRREVPVELILRRDTIEIRVQDEHPAGIVERDDFAQWLHRPAPDETLFEYDNVSWMWMGYFGLALAIEGRIPMWPLSDAVVHTLRREVRLPAPAGTGGSARPIHRPRGACGRPGQTTSPA